MSPQASPPGRVGDALTFDPVRGKVILCGGDDREGDALSPFDTWEWDGAAWTPIAVAGEAPAPRAYAALANTGGPTVLFGGLGANGGTVTGFGDTWIYETYGASCMLGSECDTAACVDGVCCDAPACGVCETCDGAASPGTCTPVVDAKDDDTCSGAKVCDATGACLLDLGQACAGPADCASASCVDGVCCAATACGTCQTCNAAGSPGVCAAVVGAADPGTCDGATRCDALGHCLLDEGQPCDASAPEACASGRCVDGVCCDADCTAACVACSAALKGTGADGACGLVAAGSRGRATCPTDPASTCQFDGTCDGQGACRLYPTETPCNPMTTCLDGADGAHSKWSGQGCDGAGMCVEVTDQDCGLVRCDPATQFCAASCATSTDCIVTAECVGSACVLEESLGEACTDDAACLSQHCADGVCCADACTGQCEACDASGQCTPRPRGLQPRSPRAQCAGDGSGCDGACDGSHVEACALPDAATPCGAATCADGEAHQAYCGGQGSCGLPVATSCSPFACGATACKASCADDAACAAGFRCDLEHQTCVGDGGVCDGDHTLVKRSGARVDCAPYRCTDADACLESCGSRLDCIDGLVCSAEGACESPEPPRSLRHVRCRWNPNAPAARRSRGLSSR